MGITAAFYDEPPAPFHLVERLLHLMQVNTRVFVERHAIGQRSVNLRDILSSQRLQFLAGTQSLIDGILQGLVNLDALAIDLL